MNRWAVPDSLTKRFALEGYPVTMVRLRPPAHAGSLKRQAEQWPVSPNAFTATLETLSS
jgi:hypothetical protein